MVVAPRSRTSSWLSGGPKGGGVSSLLNRKRATRGALPASHRRVESHGEELHPELDGAAVDEPHREVDAGDARAPRKPHAILRIRGRILVQERHAERVVVGVAQAHH